MLPKDLPILYSKGSVSWSVIYEIFYPPGTLVDTTLTEYAPNIDTIVAMRDCQIKSYQRASKLFLFYQKREPLSQIVGLYPSILCPFCNIQNYCLMMDWNRWYGLGYGIAATSKFTTIGYIEATRMTNLFASIRVLHRLDTLVREFRFTRIIHTLVHIQGLEHSHNVVSYPAWYYMHLA